MRTRIFTLLVAFLAIAGNAVWGQDHTFPGGDGSEGNPYQISTPEDLKAFRALVNGGDADACAILKNDINLNSGFTFNEEGYTGSGTPEEWEPIGYTNQQTYEMSYLGTFDGNDKTISGLYIDNSTDMLKGLFAVVGKVKVLASSTVSEKSDAIIKDLTIEGYINNQEASSMLINPVGGICCYNNGTIQGCTNKVFIKNSNSKATSIGGICASNFADIIDCANMQDLSNDATTASSTPIGIPGGGITGINTGNIEKCCNLGDVTGFNNAGGIVGSYQVREDSFIKNCYNAGNIQGTKYASGIINIISDGSNRPSTIMNCHNVGILNDGEHTAGICIMSFITDVGHTISNNYYQEETANQGILLVKNQEGTSNDQPGQTEAKSEEAFDNGEVLWFLQQKEGSERVWTQGENDDYPVFISDNNNYKAFRVTFDYNCDELPDTYQYTIEYKEETVNFPEDPTREGYTFMGWSESEEGEVISTEDVAITKDITYYAQWQKIETEEPEQPGDDEDEDQGGDIHKPQRPIKYYNIYVDTICPGLNVEVSKDVVQEGHQVSAYLTIQAECDTTGMRFEYKRGLFGYWQDLKALEGVQPGEYIIKNIYTDIYIRALDATLPEEEPTGIEAIEGAKAYAKDGSIYVYTPSREEVMIIGMSGAIIKRAEQVGLQSYSVSRGIYIVRIGDKVFKLKN